MVSDNGRILRKGRWYFGGVASATAACFTHPLDLLKVHLQTQQKEKTSLARTIITLYRHQGIFGFYNGISASLARQLTYTTVRFGVYEAGKNYINESNMSQKLFLALIAGTIGGAVGVPTDMVNVRMQNDMKLPPEQRRNYKHVVDGIIRVHREEGFRGLFAGTTTAVTRGTLMTIGQNLVYDQTKSALISLPYFEDNITLHFVTSIVAGGVSTLLTQPIDVLKTRMMNAKPGEYRGLLHAIMHTAKTGGPSAFFKGIVPAFVRLGPHTVLTFMILEQLRLQFGYMPSKTAL